MTEPDSGTPETGLYSEKELKGLATPYPDRIISCIGDGHISDALFLTEQMRHSQVILHDFFADSCTALWSWTGREFGEDVIEEMFRYVFARSAQRQFLDAAVAMAPPHLAVYLLARSWRAHCCFGAGEFPGRFRITEDSERFTFHLEPCGSGLRLMARGMYQPGRGGRITGSAHRWTYGRVKFPYYCIHCSFMNEILPYESNYGAPLWPVDPPDGPNDSCAWHVYKDPRRIPDHYYERLGVSRKPFPANRYHRPARRYFTDEDLNEMTRPMTDRISDALRKNALPRAVTLCREARNEFLVLHDLYVNMIAATLSFIVEKAGEEALGNALAYQYEKCVQTQLWQKFLMLSGKERISFLATVIFGIDACCGTGYDGGKFTIREDADEITFILAPCGSGGRLIGAGSYRPMPLTRKAAESLENGLLRLSRHVRLPEAVIRMIFPFVVNRFTQRKPFDLRTVDGAHSWSFSRPAIPCYCCQCGMFADKTAGHGIRILPPDGRGSPCVWAIPKGLPATE